MPDLKKFNSLFETPKKARLTIACSLVALITLGAVIVYIIYMVQDADPALDAPPSQSEAASGSPGQSEAPPESEGPTQTLVGIVPNLTIDQARELALADAGTAEGEAEVSREAMAQDNGVWVYEFRFRTEAAQYEYKLNANTGEIRSKVKEIFVYADPEAAEPAMPSFPAGTDPQPSDPPKTVQSNAPAPSQPPASPSAAPSQSASLYIGLEQAKAAALEHAGLTASEVTFTHAGMDREHNTMVYEIEFRQGRTEYEYEIDASTGSILSYEHDGAPATSAASAPPASESFAPVSDIGTEQAKAIALEHAGLSASEVTFSHVQLDQDHGTMVYEIEFRQDRVEYEYEIEASTGRILDYERDTH